MTDYMILLPGDEQKWESAGPEARQAVYAEHGEFTRLLEERGHHILGGAELRPSVCGILAGEGGLEVRWAITDSDPQGPTGGVS